MAFQFIGIQDPLSFASCLTEGSVSTSAASQRVACQLQLPQRGWHVNFSSHSGERRRGPRRPLHGTPLSPTLGQEKDQAPRQPATPPSPSSHQHRASMETPTLLPPPLWCSSRAHAGVPPYFPCTARTALPVLPVLPHHPTLPVLPAPPHQHQAARLLPLPPPLPQPAAPSPRVP